MKTTAKRMLSLALSLVLALSLTLPALAAGVPVTGVSLNEHTLSLVPAQTAQLTAQVTPANADDPSVTWTSNKPDVATVSETGLVTAVAEGTATIEVATTDGGYKDVCTVTVTNDYVARVELSPAGPELLPLGSQRQFTAQVIYAHGSQGDQRVTWASSNTQVATVSEDGLVTAVAEGKTEILALSEGKDQTGSPVMAICQLTVTPAGGSSTQDRLALSANLVTVQGGQGVETRLTAPEVLVHRGDQDVTDAYTLSYRWTNSAGQELGTQAVQTVQPTSLTSMTITCTVTAASKTDTAQVLTDACRYQLRVYPGTQLTAAMDLKQGTLTLEQLKNQEGTLSVLEQLTKGDGQQANGVAGLDRAVFDLSTVTGQQAGVFSAQDQTAYYLEQTGTDPVDLLRQLTFTPKEKGTYTVQFMAYGARTYYGQLTILVDDQPVVPPVESDVTCDGTGFTFTGSDFYHADDADPVLAVTFGQPSAGRLVRDLAYGAGVWDEQNTYYTNAASDGQFHISTLSYLPQAGFTGQVTIPMTLTTRSGQKTSDTLTVFVTSKSHSDQFADVNEDTVGLWAANAVDFAHHFGLVSGVADDRFAPDTPMTRAQLVTILYRAAGSPQMTVTTNFEDLDVGSYYYNAVVWATVMGVVNGTSDTTFSPDNYVTREQIAAILSRYADAMGDTVTTSGTLNAYVDKDQVSDYAVQPMIWAVDRGIISGTTDTTLSPKSTATRAQVVVMLHRYLAP